MTSSRTGVRVRIRVKFRVKATSLGDELTINLKNLNNVKKTSRPRAVTLSWLK